MAINHKIKKLIVKLLQDHQQKYIHQDAGFTSMEMMIVLLIIGILSAIALPSWLSFYGRERLNRANDAIVSILRQTQVQAKSKNSSYSASFRVNNDNPNNRFPEYIIYQGTTLPSSGWTHLGDGLGLESVFLYTNLKSLTDYNTKTNSLITTATGTGTITFDYLGTLANKSDNSTADTYLEIMVAYHATTSDAANTPQRCVIIDTLIGGIRTGKDTGC